MKVDPWITGAAVIGLILLAPKAKAALDPSPYGRWGRKWGISARLLRKIAKVESNCNPEAIRTTGGDGRRGGAYGLMQMTLATAQGIAERMPVDASTRANLARFVSDPVGALLTPDINVMFGAYYLADLKKRLGSEIMAVGAYNRGAAGIRQYIAAGNSANDLPYTQKVYAA